MSKLVVRLNIDRKERKFTAPKVISGSVFSETLRLEQQFDERRDTQFMFESLYPFICAVFGHQFTEKELLEGIDVRKIYGLANEAIDYVIANMNLHPSGEVIPFEKRKRRE